MNGHCSKSSQTCLLSEIYTEVQDQNVAFIFLFPGINIEFSKFYHPL